MNKQEFIEKLREHGAWCTEYRDRYVKIAKVRELLEQLDEPQAEKVEVSQEFADWVEKVMMWKYDGSWAVKEIARYGWGAFMHDPETEEELLPSKYHWVNDVQKNEEKHIKAIYDGYTVKPKRWVVKMATGYFMDFEEGCNEEGFEWVSSSKSCCLVFTDKSKAEAVAVLVDGSVEEV
ncbi:DUF1642 domain-containing protein [Enterococcus dispar]|uniref:DUF1642 domain-containing protein n=1 Tax=Enterococcus dispar TaxID=44009 RepID=UPI0021D47205|nr:DUF1642 domain-containing protein [Enterococcus dispar]MCU7356552.1 DUF1642 domain-containing protein [Enterococcus dispar]